MPVSRDVNEGAIDAGEWPAYDTNMLTGTQPWVAYHDRLHRKDGS